MTFSYRQCATSRGLGTLRAGAASFHRFESVHAHAPLQNDDDAFDRLKEAHRQAESERQP